MDFASIETPLPALFSTLMGIPCQWATQPRKLVVGAGALIDILGDDVTGLDERVTEYVDDAGAVVDVAAATGARETVFGFRELTLQVTIWGISQKLASSARFYLGKLRTKLRFTSTIAALKAMGLALAERQPVVQDDPTQDGRAMSQASLDLRFTYGVAESDAAAPFIETARLESQSIRNAAGDAEPSSLQSDITVDLTP